MYSINFVQIWNEFEKCRLYGVFFFRAFHLTSVRREVKSECVSEEMVYVFDEISLTLNPELVCHDKNVLIIKVTYVLHLGK